MGLSWGREAVELATRIGEHTAVGVTHFVSHHPKLIIGGAIAAGAIAAHPIRRSGMAPIFQEEVLGDPNAFSTIARGVITDRLHQALYTPGEQNAREYLTNNYRAGPPIVNGAPVPGTGPYTGPTGDIVFGLYNLRQ